MFQQLLQNQFSKGLNFDQQQTVQLDLLLDGGLIEKQFIFEMKENSGHEDTHSVRLWPWTQLKKSTMKKKSTAEEQRDTTQRGKIAEVPRIGERGSKKGGTARLHSCPSKEQMSLFFFRFPSCCSRRIHVREEGEEGGGRGGWEEEREEDQGWWTPPHGNPAPSFGQKSSFTSWSVEQSQFS